MDHERQLADTTPVLPRSFTLTTNSRKHTVLNGVFLEAIGVGKDDLQFNLRRVVDSLARIVETRARRVSV